MTAREHTQHRTALLENAVFYAARLGWAVVPDYEVDNVGQCRCARGAACPSPGKHPRTPNGHKDATTEAPRIQQWWADAPDANARRGHRRERPGRARRGPREGRRGIAERPHRAVWPVAAYARIANRRRRAASPLLRSRVPGQGQCGQARPGPRHPGRWRTHRRAAQSACLRAVTSGRCLRTRRRCHPPRCRSGSSSLSSRQGGTTDRVPHPPSRSESRTASAMKS